MRSDKLLKTSLLPESWNAVIRDMSAGTHSVVRRETFKSCYKSGGEPVFYPILFCMLKLVLWCMSGSHRLQKFYRQIGDSDSWVLGLVRQIFNGKNDGIYDGISRY